MESFNRIIERFKTKMASVLLLIGGLFCILILSLNLNTQTSPDEPLTLSLLLSSAFMLTGSLAIYKYPRNRRLRNSCILLLPSVIWINTKFTNSPDISGGYIYIPAVIVTVTFLAGFWHGFICYLTNLAFLFAVAMHIGFDYQASWQEFDKVLFLDRGLAFTITFLLAAFINRVFRQAIDAIHYLEEKQHQRQRLSSLAGLVGGLAHEFNNPLQVIEWCLQALTKDQPSAQGQKWISKATQSAERIKDITHSLLFFTDSSARMTNLDRSQRVIDAWQDACGKLAQEIKQHQITLVCQLPDEQLFFGQRFHLSTILHAIVQNAIDAVQSSPLADRRIELTHRTNQDYFEVQIRDHGQGIPQPIASKIFEPFYSNKEKHIGLGLSSCYAICQALHWQLSFHTPRDGKGTCFVLRMPNPKAIEPKPPLPKAS